MDRRFREVAGPAGLPQRARIADIGGMEIQRRIVRATLGERARRQQQERSDSPTSAGPTVRPLRQHRGRSFGSLDHWDGDALHRSRTVRVVESCDSPH